MQHYTIIQETLPSALEYEVKRLLEQGFRPLGGVSVGNGLYIQAMWKEPDSAEVHTPTLADDVMSRLELKNAMSNRSSGL